MKKIFAALILGFLCWPFQAALSNDTACDVIRVNGTTGWFPIIMRPDEEKTSFGILPDVMAEIAKRMGIKISFEEHRPWKRLFVQLDKAQLDVIMGVYWTSERADKYLYSDPIVQDEIAVFVKSNKVFELIDLDDLIGRIGIRPLGGSYGEAFDQFALQYLDMDEIPSNNETKIIDMLMLERADYAVLGRFDGLEDINKSKNQGKIIDLPRPITTNAVHFLFSKTSPCANKINEINTIINILTAEGVIKQLEYDYLTFKN